MNENNSGVVKGDDQMELPPGFRFHPTDEELITQYLSKKVLDPSFSAIAIGEVDMNNVEPWELPGRAKVGEKEWYFFCVRDKKYPTGLRTNRATAKGYWKATGKDREIFRGKTLVGMKKTLVFYNGRAPKGEKTNWVTHEYRLGGKFSLQNLPKQAKVEKKNDWVISRVFHKTSGGKKLHISELTRMNSEENISSPSTMPSITERIEPVEPVTKHEHVHCFSNPITGICLRIMAEYESRVQKREKNGSLSQEIENSSVVPNIEIRKIVFEEEQESLACSVGAQDLDCIWSY